jgi:hypothetical protein
VIGKSTPRFAKILSWKYANMAGEQTQQDLRTNHGLEVSKKLIQSVSQRVGEILIAKEQKWSYVDPVLTDQVENIGISRDGTTTPIKGEGYKETMVGTISLYNGQGDRLHTIYTACPPQHGKETFDYVLSQEIERIQAKYPDVHYRGIADGAKDNWSFLNRYTHSQIVDYWHATQYLAEYAKVVYAQQNQRKEWLSLSCRKLKEKKGAAQRLITEMKKYAAAHFLQDKYHPVLRAITYFTNNKARMQYWQNQKDNLPIGSGVVEAACKTLVKQRFSRSGCKWTRDTVDSLLLARSLIITTGRWNQFWNKVDRYGC